MSGRGRRLFNMNVGELALVCLFNTVPGVASSQWIARATGVKMRTQLRSVQRWETLA
jgi:hypothetical protein